MEAFTTDPLLASAYVRTLEERVWVFERALSVGPVAADPFRGQTTVGKTWREAVLASRDFEPIKGPLIAHLDHLLERRLNQGALLEESTLLTQVEHRPRPPFVAPGTWSERRLSALIASSEPNRNEEARAAWQALSADAAGLSAVRVLRYERRVEVEGRLGARLTPLVSFSAPATDAPGASEGPPPPQPDVSALARGVLLGTRDAAQASLSPGFAGLVQGATGFPAVEGWPARLAPESLLSLLGGRWLVSGATPAAMALPERACPASFLRAAAQLGRLLVRAGVPQSVPFVVARTPAETYGRALGRLLALWLLSPTCAHRRLGLGPEGRARHARGAARFLLAESRLVAARALMAEAGRQSRQELDRTWAELEVELGTPALGPPLGLFAAPPEASVELVAHLWSLSLLQELVRTYDEDFLDNPRAQQALLATVHAPEPSLPDHATLLDVAATLSKLVEGATG